MIEVIAAGALTTVQDFGRTGFAAKGYPECGAADKYAMRLANILAGNGAKSTCAVLEFTLQGATLRFTEAAIIALTGADLNASLTSTPPRLLPFMRAGKATTHAIAPYHPVVVSPGDVLTLGVAQTGLRAYLGVYGGIATAPVMGSRATDLKCHIGGVNGRVLAAGDCLPVGSTARESIGKAQSLAKAMQNSGFTSAHEEALRAPLHPWRVQGDVRVPILRAVLGPQEEAFTQKGLASFTSTLYTLTKDSNRMACKLTGEAIETVSGSDILSDGIVEGSVQVSSDGSPIVMLADHQTTGGYAKIATVIRSDVAVLAQLRPGEQVAFRFVSPQEAVQIARDEARKLAWIAEQLGE